MATFESAIPYVLRHEGGFVQHAADPGGSTKYGVALRTLHELEDDEQEEWDLDHDGDVDADDVRQIGLGQAVAFYKKHFWIARFDEIDAQHVATKIFDIAVNAGRRQATLIAQRAVNWFDDEIILDGIFGPQTVEKINQCEPARLYKAIQAEQARFYVELVNAKRTRQVFLLGWLRRAFDH